MKRIIRRLGKIVLVAVAITAVVVSVGTYIGLGYVPGGRESVSFSRVFSDGEIRYTLHPDLLQSQVAAIFPIKQGVEGLVQIHLRNPQFVPDADGSYLRVNIDLEVLVVSTGERFPGAAVVRTQLYFDRAGEVVTTRQAELAEFAFTGEAASVAESLRPVLRAALAGGMEGEPVFKLPEDSGRWARIAFSLLRDVRVENGRVVAILGW